MRKQNKKRGKIMNKLALISYSEMFILILAMFSFSYIIYSFSETSVSAASTATAGDSVCCEKTTDGKWCETTTPDKCDKSYNNYLSNCSEVTEGYCQKGCCMSKTTGECYKRSSKADCIKYNGTFTERDELCSNADCRMGCCQLGNADAQLTSSTKCDFLSNSQNIAIPKTWIPDIVSELKCKYSVKGEKEGACVFKSGDGNSCAYTTLEDCVARTGNEANFDIDGKFCSDPTLNTICKAKDHKGCIDEKDDVYWFDSCGNKEGIADDCDLFKGNFCGKSFGDYVCKSVTCNVDGKIRQNGESWCEYDNVIGMGKDPAGSRHVRHVCYMGVERIEPCSDYRNQICVASTAKTSEGVEFSQASCRMNNWRKCLELNSKKSTQEMEEKCKKNPDCWVKQVDMGGSFNFKVCLPQYPPGFNLDDNTDSAVGNAGDSICSVATQRCTETWICGIFGCICVDNCKCHTDYFTTEMNDFCISLGDCGGYINYVGVYTDGGYGLKSTGGAPPRLDMRGLASRAGPKPAKPGDFEFFESIDLGKLKSMDAYKEFLEGQSTDLGSINSNISSLESKLNNLRAQVNNATDRNDAGAVNRISGEYNSTYRQYQELLEKRTAIASGNDSLAVSQEFKNEIQKVSGSMGSPLLLYMVSHDTVNGSVEEEALNGITPNTATGGSYFNAFSSVRSAISAQIVQKDIKAGGFEMIAAMIAGLIAYVITQSIMMAFMAAMMAYLFALAWIMYVYIDFSCNMWERPAGNADCNKCNALDVPCTEYRCQSLGELCKFVNKGTNNELCLAMEANASIPTIEPLFSSITSGYKYDAVEAKGFEVRKNNGQCVDPFTTIRIGIKTTPFTKCRFSTDPTQKWEDMSEPFGIKGDSILPTHMMDLFFPSPEAVKRSFGGEMICNTTTNPCKEQIVEGRKTTVCPKCNLTDDQIEELTKTEFYVKCKTAYGKQNFEPYRINTCINPGPDLTPPAIRKVLPNNGGYVKYGQTNQTVVVYVDEPSECRWSSDDKAFDQMSDKLSCRDNIVDYQGLIEGENVIYGLPCFGDINLTNTDSARFYIRCRDLSVGNNTMVQSYVYEITKSESPLVIEEFRPLNNQKIVTPQDPANVLLKVETSGGAEQGLSNCKWYSNDVDYMYENFPGNFTKTHEYTWNLARRGAWNLTYECEDAAGNLAINSTFFRIIIDDVGPKIVRIFNDGGITVMTSEPADECRYSTKKNFIYDNATVMYTSNKIEHRASVKSNSVYYIVCKDTYGNRGSMIAISPVY